MAKKKLQIPTKSPNVTDNSNILDTTVTVIDDGTSKKDAPPADQVQKYGYFVTPVYHISKPNFLTPLQEVSDRLLTEHKKEFPNLNAIYPVRQTTSILSEPTLKEFFDFVGGTAWNAMNSEGYDMSQFSVIFHEMWVQEHYKHSGHDEHVHPYGSQMVGFYFLDTPPESGRLVMHDPRPAKRQINLPEQNMSMATDASTAINFEPKAGDLYFAPSWVPHSISRHGGDSPLRLVHITMGVIPNQQTLQSNQETMSTATVI
jgi:hypothetical protein